MLKRTMGRFLLTVLVITGLAGTINNTSLSKQERKTAISLMKDTRTEVLKSVKGLTNEQLNFKAGPDRWSIKECMYHIAITEEKLWGMMETNMKSPGNPEKRADIKISDDGLIKMIEDRSTKVKTMEPFEPKNSPYKTMDEAVMAYKNMRAEHIKYMKMTTEDLRNHVTVMPFGSIDCYQFCLFIAAHNNRHRQQIDEVKADPKFPR
jgi:hypothetical protein